MHQSPYVILVHDGEWTEDDGSDRRRLGREDVLFHPAGVEHETHAAGGTVVTMIDISVTILADFCGLYGFYPRTILTAFDDVDWIPERIREEMSRADDATTAVVYSLVLQLLAVGCRAPIEANPITPEWMPRLIAYIHANLRAPLTVQQLAKQVAVSESHLSHSFVRYFRCSVSDYIRDCQLRAAARALRYTGDSVEKIAWETGFSDQSNFCRAFKASNGVTPTQYRASQILAAARSTSPRRESRNCCDIR